MWREFPKLKIFRRYSAYITHLVQNKQMSKLSRVNVIAKRRGFSEKIELSPRKSKKFVVIYRGKPIHFGASGYEDFDDHGDPERRKNYHRRAKGIRDGDGRLTYRNKNSANFWAINILW